MILIKFLMKFMKFIRIVLVIASGIFLVHYGSNIQLAFGSVEHIMRELDD